MSAFIKLVFDVCLLKAGPEDMPAQRPYLILAAAFYSVVVLIVFSVTEWRLSPLLLTLQAMLSIALATGLILHLAGHGSRLRQTLTALYATSAMMSLVPLLMQPLINGDIVPSVVINAVILIMFFWSFAIDSHIFSRSLQVSMWIGLLISIVLFLFNQILLTPWQAPA
ncbi:MAG: hypothetical protein Tsb002_05860 [Wenzhouxiangellaceae bacterium]